MAHASPRPMPALRKASEAVVPGTARAEHYKEHWAFLGVLTPREMATFFHDCAVTVLPSLNSTESFGLVQVEGMLCGAPANNLRAIRVGGIVTATYPPARVLPRRPYVRPIRRYPLDLRAPRA